MELEGNNPREPAPVSLRAFLAINLCIVSVVIAAVRKKAAGGLALAVITMYGGVVKRFLAEGDFSSAALGRLAKITVCAPLGLGSVLAYAALPEHVQERYMGAFTAYINLAVVGNILMMVLVPSENLEWRLISSRICCVSLVTWLLLSMRADYWKTVVMDKGAFLFVSVPLDWILAHAAYRFVLLSLPCFDSLKYILLEATSLSLMRALHQAYDPARPVEYFFGFADTIAVATTALTTGLVPTDSSSYSVESLGVNMNLFDRMGALVQSLIAVYALSRCTTLMQRTGRDITVKKQG